MIIGISGKARSGKDTVCGMIQDYLPNSHRYAFADPIKDACRVIFSWTDEHLYGNLKEVEDPFFKISPRKALQTLGSEWGRDMINRDLWLLVAEKFCNEHEHVIIPDIRFQNEYDWIKNNNGIIIHIERPGILIESSAHQSESLGLTKMIDDYYIVNNRSLDWLRSDVKRIVEDLPL